MKKTDIQRVDERELDGKQRYALLKPTIPTYTIYSILKKWFGPSSEPEDKVQWQYNLRVPGAYLIVRDYKVATSSVEIYPDVEDDKAEQIGESFINLLAKEANSYTKKRQEVRRKAKSHIFLNPYSTYFFDAEQLLELAKKLDTQQNSDTTPQNEDLKTMLNTYLSQRYQTNALIRASFFLFISAFEGFLNTIYELYLKPALRNKRVYDKLSREQIDLKINLAPVYCTCFVSDEILFADDLFDKFSYIINQRNDFIHANLTQHLKTAIIQEDGNTFLVEPEESGKYGLPMSLANLTIDNMEFIRSVMIDMTKAILDSMNRDDREIFEVAMNLEDFGVLEEDGKYTILMRD